MKVSHDFEITEYFDADNGLTGKMFQALDKNEQVVYERDYGSTYPDLYEMIQDYYEFLDKPKNSLELKLS